LGKNSLKPEKIKTKLKLQTYGQDKRQVSNFWQKYSVMY